MAQRIRLPHKFDPRWYQRDYMAYFDDGGKRADCCWHRRSGKDTVALHQTNKMAHEDKGVYWHMLRTERQTRKAIWHGIDHEGLKILDHVFPREIRKYPKDIRPNAEMLIELKCGSLIMFLGSDNFDSHVGSNPRGVTYSEFSLCKPSAWDYIRPILRQNNGWASFIYTPRGKNHAWKLHEMAKKNSKWLSSLLSVYDTGVFSDPDAVMAEELAEGMEQALIDQEYKVDFSAALVGSYYGALLQALELRGGLAEFDHGTDEVFTSWDLGHSDSTAIWFWRVQGDQISVIDHFEANGKPMSYYFDLIEQWSEERKYRYAKHWMPHDARAKTLQTGASIIEQCVSRWGASRVSICPELSLADGIQAARKLLQGNIRFHPRCSKLNHPGDSDGVECLKQYHKEWDDDRHCYVNHPEHDWTSHTADAFRYLACVVRASEFITRKPDNAKSVAANPNAVRLDDVWKTVGRKGPSGRI